MTNGFATLLRTMPEISSMFWDTRRVERYNLKIPILPTSANNVRTPVKTMTNTSRMTVIASIQPPE